MAPQVPVLKQSNGTEMPVLGLGTWKSKPNEVTQAVKDAIDAGYRHFDCAFVYQNESEVGAGIKAKIDEGVVKREDLWVTSKLWNTFHRPDLVKQALEKTLSNLGLKYLDLYLIHWPQAFKEGSDLFPVDAAGNFVDSDADFVDTWKEMEKMVDAGLTRSIGISNFNSVQVERLLKSARIKPITNQVECHPFLNQAKLIKFCNDRGISITAYSPLGSPDHPNITAEVQRPLQHETVVNIAKKYNKSPGQVLLRYQIQLGNIVIPKSVTKSRIQENMNIFDFVISDDDMAKLNSVYIHYRFCELKGGKDFPFNIEF